MGSERLTPIGTQRGAMTRERLATEGDVQRMAPAAQSCANIGGIYFTAEAGQQAEILATQRIQ